MACDLKWELVPELRGRVGRSFLIDPACLPGSKMGFVAVVAFVVSLSLLLVVFRCNDMVFFKASVV